jgi:hypothetical protein
MFSQYGLTTAGVLGGTGYSLYKRPKNGIGVMLVAGGAGTVADLIYGWNVACRTYVEAWKKHEMTEREERSKSS